MGKTWQQNGNNRTRDHRSDLTKVPVVYFDYVTFPELPKKPVIKIGESGNHAKRRGEHAKSKFGVAFDVQHLCLVRGGRADEQHVLRYFAQHKLDNEEETFHTHPDLIDYIRWLRDQYFVWVPDDEQCPPIEALDVIDGSVWSPAPGRSKAPPAQTGLFDDYGPLRLPPRVVTVDDFYTNSRIVEPARLTMGRIDLDPASHAFANQVIHAARYFTISDNGLSREWSGAVWLNPPFSQWEKWVPKIVGEWRSGRITAMCILCATRTLTAQYFAPIHRECTGVCVIHGRIPFYGGRATTSPDDGHAVFYFGRDFSRFGEAFGEIGHVYKR